MPRLMSVAMTADAVIARHKTGERIDTPRLVLVRGGAS